MTEQYLVMVRFIITNPLGAGCACLLKMLKDKEFNLSEDITYNEKC